VNSNNPILRSENYTFVLDGFPMLLALLLLNVMHPGLVLRGPESEFAKLTRKEKKMMKQEKKKQKRMAIEEKRQRKMNGKYGQTGHYIDGNITDSREGIRLEEV
jgi:RTA1 like protein